MSKSPEAGAVPGDLFGEHEDYDLPSQARLRIVAKRAAAEDEFRAALSSLKRDNEPEYLIEAEDLLVAFIDRDFCFFVEEAIKTDWSAETVRERAERFLSRSIDRTFVTKHPRARAADCEKHRAEFHERAVSVVENWATWQRFKQALAIRVLWDDASKIQQPLPALPREALSRIAEAERDERRQYDRDKIPYFPRNPSFSFLETSVLRSLSLIVEYVRIFAERVLNAHMREYLEHSPLDLLTNPSLLKSVTADVARLTNELWSSYLDTLDQEPLFREAGFIGAKMEGTLDQHAELEPCRYPTDEKWTNFMNRLKEPGSEIEQLNARYDATIRQTFEKGIKTYQREAASRLQIRPSQVSPQAGGTGGPTLEKSGLQNPQPQAAEANVFLKLTQVDTAAPNPSETIELGQSGSSTSNEHLQAADKNRELSQTDQSVHAVVGEINFRNLPNAEIMKIKSMKKQLHTKFKLMPGTNATKSCFDRIRKAYGYPLSNEIRKKRSRQ